jgi:hypothetical protein
MLLAYTSRDAWDAMDITSEEFQAACAFYVAISQELTSSGELMSTEGLGHPSLSHTIRPSADGPVVSDGPFAETKEVLVSFSIIDVVDHDRAMGIAARLVDGVGDAIELRSIMDGPLEEGLPER